MAQKSNIQTIRAPEHNLNLRTNNTKEVLNLLTFLKVLNRSLNKKGILSTKTYINSTTKTCYLNLTLFFKTHKLSKYKNKLKNIKSDQKEIKTVLNLMRTKLKYKLLISKIEILNKFINVQEAKIFFSLFKNFKNNLFSRRFTLFIDFLKLTTLFVNKKINTENYLKVLGIIFTVLPKNKHNKYLMFLRYLFEIIVRNQTNGIKGIKFIINGKLKGKLRASSARIVIGKISNQTISTNIEYNKLHVYTVYGAFGIKMWTNSN